MERAENDVFSAPCVVLAIIEKLKYFAPSLSSLRFFISAINVPISAGTKWLITALRLTTFDTARTPSRNISIFYTGAYLSTLHQIFTNIPEGENIFCSVDIILTGAIVQESGVAKPQHRSTACGGLQAFMADLCPFALGTPVVQYGMTHVFFRYYRSFQRIVQHNLTNTTSGSSHTRRNAFVHREEGLCM